MAKVKSSLASKHHGGMQNNFGESKVEDRAWLSNKAQIDRLMAAGLMQQHWETAHFAEIAEVPDDYVPPNYAPTELEILAEARAILAGKTAAEARKAVAEAAVTPPSVEEPAAPEEASASGGSPTPSE